MGSPHNPIFDFEAGLLDDSFRVFDAATLLALNRLYQCHLDRAAKLPECVTGTVTDFREPSIQTAVSMVLQESHDYYRAQVGVAGSLCLGICFALSERSSLVA